MDRAGDNWNRGQKVRIKLRRPDGSFEMYEHVLLVMLHELCHNEFGSRPWLSLFDVILYLGAPRSDSRPLLNLRHPRFPQDRTAPRSTSSWTRYRRYGPPRAPPVVPTAPAEASVSLLQECEELMAKGVGGQGTGFDAPGQKLGHRGGWCGCFSGVTSPRSRQAVSSMPSPSRPSFSPRFSHQGRHPEGRPRGCGGRRGEARAVSGRHGRRGQAGGRRRRRLGRLEKPQPRRGSPVRLQGCVLFVPTPPR